MSAEHLAALLFSFALNGVALWGAFRRKRTEVRAADAKQEAAVEDGAIARYQALLTRLETKYEAQERGMEALRVRELECAAKTARQEVQIENLKDALRGLRADLKRAGIAHGSGPHEPLDHKPTDS